MIKILPAVDLSHGKCVRLTKGIIDHVKIYYDDPLDAARRWEDEGAEFLHIIDLDAAVGIGENAEAIIRIIKKTGVPAEVGGGIRTIERAKKYVQMGAERVIFGTGALDSGMIREALLALGATRVMAAVDHLGGKVAVKGWKQLMDLDAMLLCKKLEESGVQNIMMTSIDRDGTMKGPNLDYSLDAASQLSANLFIAGGFSTLNDIKLLKGSKVAGIILGKALYEGTINLTEAKEAVK